MAKKSISQFTELHSLDESYVAVFQPRETPNGTTLNQFVQRWFIENCKGDWQSKVIDGGVFVRMAMETDYIAALDNFAGKPQNSSSIKCKKSVPRQHSIDRLRFINM